MPARNSFICMIITMGIVLLGLLSCVPHPDVTGLPEIKSVSAEVTGNTCELTAEISDASHPGYEIGFMYGKDEGAMDRVQAQSDGAVFKCRLLDLEYDTGYVYKAYVSNGRNEICSDVESFRTMAEEQTENSVILPFHTKEVGRLSSRFSFEVGGNADFSVAVPEDVDWLRCGVNDRVCVVFVETNDTEFSRSCEIVFSNLFDNQIDTLVVYQQAADASETNLPFNDVVLPPVEVDTWMTLLMDPDINVCPLDDGSAEADWLRCVSVTNIPYGYSEVSFRAEENTADEDRIARFIVSYDGYDSVITVTQKAANAVIEFEDPFVGIVLVDAFDQDGDGRLSYAEAARLTINDAEKIDFSGLEGKSFEELRYFTEFWYLQSPSFAGSNIERVSFPNKLSGLGNGLFENCTELKEIELNCIKVGNHTFRGCTGLKNIRAEIYGKNAFDGCTALETVQQQYAGVPKQAFLNCMSLNSFEFRLKYVSDGYIGYEAFRGCSSLPEISIPDVIEAIDDRAFYGCSSLTAVYMERFDPPILGEDVFTGTSPDLNIYVRPESVSRYRAAWPSLEDRIKAQSPEGEDTGRIFLPFHHISLKSGETEFTIEVGGTAEFEVEISPLNIPAPVTHTREGRRCTFRLEGSGPLAEDRYAAVFRNLDNDQCEILYVTLM